MRWRSSPSRVGADAAAGAPGSAAVVVTAIAAAAVVGATRLYLRAHYLSDVLAGFGARGDDLRGVRDRRPDRRLHAPQWGADDVSNQSITYLVVAVCGAVS